jgi:GH25 family lysozyme M1 (1,4-beta-N-acetylmuramidase)|nr:MAG TPA: hypothetical protein [Caudoviricetes sp.]
MSDYNCVDVSEWNDYIDWNKAKNDGVEYAFIRAGFGQDYESQDDKFFHINMENAIKAGIKVGVYFYSYAINTEQAIGEAEHCLRLITPYKDTISFPIFYDVEESKIEHHIGETIPAFINYLNDRGFNAGVYCTTSWFDNYFKDIACSYFWFASWGDNDGTPHKKPQWCDIWQYTSKGSVNGIGKNSVDCDILYNTDMKLLKDCSKNIYVNITVPEDIEVHIEVHKEG